MSAAPFSLGLALDAARPAAAWALCLPLLFLWLQRALERSPTVVIGTLDLWSGETPARPRGRYRRGRFPAWALWIALGLLCGALAWLGPRGARAAAGRRWTCVVDRSPSLALPLAGSTRLARALEAAGDWLARHASAADRVRWIAAGREALELPVLARPDEAWLRNAGPESEMDWARWDEAGALWITDRAPESARRHAGLFASGGPAVPGAIAAEGAERLVWDGASLARRPAETPPAVVLAAQDGRVPEVLERMLRAWAAARGAVLEASSNADAVLTLERAPSSGAEVEVEFGRDGWQARGRSAGAGVPAALRGEDWLAGQAAGGAELVLLRARPGRVVVALSAMDEPSGDPARFALSFGQLFDRCALAPPGVVPLAERQAAGEPVAEGGEPASLPAAEHDLGPYVDAALALAAAGACSVAFALRARGA